MISTRSAITILEHFDVRRRAGTPARGPLPTPRSLAGDLGADHHQRARSFGSGRGPCPSRGAPRAASFQLPCSSSIENHARSFRPARRRSSARTLALLGLLLCLAPARALADDNHYQTILIGDRATGLGGAFTAISDDSAGVYYNPAGLAEAPHSSLSLFGSVYGYASQSYSIADLDFQSDNRSFVSYPTAAAWIQRVRRGDELGRGRVQLGLALVTPQAEVSRQRIALRAPERALGGDQTAALDTFSTTVAEDDTLWIGLAAAWKVARWLSVGASLFVTYRSGLYQSQTLALDHSYLGGVEVARVGEVDRLDVRLRHFGLLGVVGAVVRLGERLRLGASFRTPSLELHGRGELERFWTPRDSSGKYSLATSSLTDVRFRDRQPWKATLGAAFGRARRYGVALDVSVYGPVGDYPIFEDASDPAAATSLRMKKRLIAQVNAGGEYYLLRWLPLRLGFFTNLSSLARACDGQICPEHDNFLTSPADLFGFAGSVGYESERVTLNVGWSYCVGGAAAPVSGYALRRDLAFFFASLGGAFRF